MLVNHLEPVNGVLAKRQAQANALADYVHGRQQNDPNEALVVVGDFNAFSFNDGYVDTVGTVRGVPAPANQVAFETVSLVSPALLDLGAALAPEAQYSFVLNGNAQTHEHVLASANLASQVAGVARPRVNGDFPDARGATTEPLRAVCRPRTRSWPTSRSRRTWMRRCSTPWWSRRRRKPPGPTAPR